VPLYFQVHDAVFFHGQIVPALGASWRLRSFAPCRPLCESLKPAVEAFAERFHTGGEEPVLARVGHGLPFDRAIWRLLAGEVLLYGARDCPEIVTAPETLACLLARPQYLECSVPRAQFAPIYQAHYGARDLVFGGGFYRPDQAGLNDLTDVARLAAYLDAIDPGQWSVVDLAALGGPADDEERQEELELARDWFPALQQLYRRAAEEKQVIVCELLGKG
jgi:hypothetical protein